METAASSTSIIGGDACKEMSMKKNTHKRQRTISGDKIATDINRAYSTGDIPSTQDHESSSPPIVSSSSSNALSASVESSNAEAEAETTVQLSVSSVSMKHIKPPKSSMHTMNAKTTLTDPDQQLTKEYVSLPQSSTTVTPVTSANCIVKRRSPVRLPSCSRFSKGDNSESSFVDLIRRMNSNSTRQETMRTNATFRLIQRSGKESVLASLHEIELLVARLKASETKDNGTEIELETESSSASISTSASASAASTKDSASFISLHTSLAVENLPDANMLYQDFVGLSGYTQDEYYRIILVRANAIQITIDAMRLLKDHKLTQASGNLFIGSMCETRQQGLKLVESGGLKVIVDSIKNFSTSSSVCSLAINTLFKCVEATDLAMMFLENMHGSREVIESIPEELLSHESLGNRNALIERFGRSQEYYTKVVP